MLNSGGTEDILGNSFEEIDLEYVKNPQLVEIYAAEIIENLMQSEVMNELIDRTTTLQEFKP